MILQAFALVMILLVNMFRKLLFGQRPVLPTTEVKLLKKRAVKNANLITRFSFSRNVLIFIFFFCLAFNFPVIPPAEAQQNKITNFDTKYIGDNLVGITLNMAKPSSAQSPGPSSQYSTTLLIRNSRQVVTMSFCGDGFCDIGIEDNPINSKYCPSDCQGYCGNGRCEIGENCSSCSGDCPCTCGNGVCSADETCVNCQIDCLSCCGNGICEENELGEKCNNCPQDCRACGSTEGPCFLSQTPILMTDGSTKPIQKIKKGDGVLSFDEKSNQFKPGRVTKVLRHNVKEYLIINGHLEVTSNHPVLSDGRWVPIGKLKKGSSLVNEKGERVAIDTVEKVSLKVTVYNIKVNPYHTYVAGGYVVHNGSIPVPK